MHAFAAPRAEAAANGACLGDGTTRFTSLGCAVASGFTV
jgi:hypothetical protein